VVNLCVFFEYYKSYYNIEATNKKPLDIDYSFLDSQLLAITFIYLKVVLRVSDLWQQRSGNRKTQSSENRTKIYLIALSYDSIVSDGLLLPICSV